MKYETVIKRTVNIPCIKHQRYSKFFREQATVEKGREKNYVEDGFAAAKDKIN